jgi:hypothetical protein
MHWSYEDVRQLPRDVYIVLVEMLTAQMTRPEPVD